MAVSVDVGVAEDLKEPNIVHTAGPSFFRKVLLLRLPMGMVMCIMGEMARKTGKKERNTSMQLSQTNGNAKKQFWLCMLSVLIWGMAAHGYGFLHSSFSHDSLSEFNGGMGSNSWKIQLGRIAVPVYKAIFRTNLTLPWMCGLLALIWIGLAVFLTARMLSLRNRAEIFLIAGVFTVNLTVTATAATYLHDFDGNMFGMLCAAAAVFLWQRYRFGYLVGSVLLAVCMGIYQSYLSVAIVLILLICIGWLLKGEAFAGVFRRGLTAIGMLLLGGILYALMLGLTWKLSGITPASGSSNTLDLLLTLTPRDILRLMRDTYFDTFRRLFRVITPYPQWMIRAATGLLLLLTAGLFIAALRGKGKRETLLSIVLAALIPLGMNVVYVLSSGMVHDLMVYGIWLSYLPALLLAFGSSGRLKKGIRWGCALLAGFLLYADVQTANVLYLKKDMEQDAFLSYMTRVVYTMESCDGYVAGQTPVVFVGDPPQNSYTIPGFERYAGITGADSSGATGLTEDFRARAYFQYVLNDPALIPGSDVFAQMESDPRVDAMPEYPESGSVAMIDGVLVVKFS